MPKLCTGCGVEMISGGGGGNNDKQMAAGHDAFQGNSRTKKQEKKARYADIFDRGQFKYSTLSAMQIITKG